MNTDRIVPTNTTSNCHHDCGAKCISWSAIFIAAFIAIGFSFLLNLFSTALGLSIYRVNADGVNALTVGGMLAFGIGIIVTMFISGWIAGFVGRSHCERKYCGALHGFGAWCVSLVLMILLALPFSRFIANYTNYLSHTTATNMVVNANSSTTRTNVTAPQNEDAINDLGKGAFVLFLMFFLGAIASTAGGHVGTICCEKKECSHCHKTC